jgi:hypothetical protein
MATNGKLPVGVSQKIKQIGRMDLPGGGSIVVENGYAYVGHIEPPHGTSIIDVRDPRTRSSWPSSKYPRAFTLTKFA